MHIVYFVQGKQTGLIKIGTSTTLANVFLRFKELQKLNCDELDLIAVGRPLDVVNKTMFQTHHGEWFSPTPDLLAYISIVKERLVVERGKPDYRVAEKIWKKHGMLPPTVSIDKNEKPAVKKEAVKVSKFKEMEFGPEEKRA